MKSSPDCLFCKIVAGSIPAGKIYEDDAFICFADIHPQAKTHLLVVPKEHVASLEAAFPAEGGGKVELMGRMLEVATLVARQKGLLPQGFRTVINTNAHAGQTVFHIHLHLLGGESLEDSFA